MSSLIRVTLTDNPKIFCLEPPIRRSQFFNGMRLFLLAVCVVQAGCDREELTYPVPRTSELRAAAGVTPPIDAETVMQRAGRLIEQAQFKEAERLLKPLLLVQPYHSGGLFLIAQAEAGQGRLETAIETLRVISPEEPQLGLAALGQAADWMIQLGRYDDAEANLLQLVSRDSEIAIVRRRLAQLLNNQGRRIQAAPHLRKLAELGDATPDELYGMVTFSDPFIHTNLDGTELKIPTVGLSEARLLHQRGDFRAARELTQKLWEEQPHCSSIAAFYLRLMAEMQDQAGFAKSLSQVPHDIAGQPEYWHAMGIFQQRQGKHDFAIRCFLEAVRLDDTDRSSYLGLARSLKAVEQGAAASKVLRRYAILDEIASINIAPERSEEQLHRMPLLLRMLRRDAEASAWENVGNGKIPHSAPESGPAKIADSPVLDAMWVTCGINLEDWPLPVSSEVIASDLATHEHEADELTVEATPQAMTLINVAEKVGLDFLYEPGPGTDRETLLLPETVGDGIAVIDFDLDGWPDLYFTQGGGKAFESDGSLPNRLWRNLHGTSFVDITASSETGDHGYGQGVAAADIDQDGFLDLIVANIGPNILYRNNGDGTFSRSELAASGIDGNQWTTTIACGDVTGDGLPEIVEVNYIDDPAALVAECIGSAKFPLCNPQQYRPAQDRILRNVGDGRFEPIRANREQRPPGYGFAAVIANFDQQAGNDLFIANDTSGNQYWISEDDPTTSGRYTLLEQAKLFGIAHGPNGISLSSMGIAAGDFDRNGRIDLQISNYANEPADLFMQHSTGVFSNENFHYGLDAVTKPTLGWGTQAADIDHDGWLDLVVVNGSLYSQSDDGVPYRMSPQVIRGAAGRFESVKPTSLGDPFWTTPTLGRTLATIDWNRDGKVDFVATHLDAPAALLQNETDSKSEEVNPNHWVQFDLVGTQSERDAVGTEVTVHCGDHSWTTWVTGGDGFLCSNDPVLSVGLGVQQRIDSVDIHWSSGHTETLDALEVNHRYLIVEGENSPLVW